MKIALIHFCEDCHRDLVEQIDWERIITVEQEKFQKKM